MALTTYNEIKERVREHLTQLKETPYPEDLLSELADSESPIYYSDVMKEWCELPSEYCDRWKEYGYDANKNEGGIFSLMSIDLTFYYLEEFNNAWEEIKKEEEE